MSKSNRVVRNTTFLYIKVCISLFVTLYSTRLVIGALGVSDFGVYNVVAAAIAMFGFLNAAMTITTQRFMNYYEGRQDVDTQKIIFNVSVVLHLSIAFIMGLFFALAEPLVFDYLLSIDEGRIEAARWVFRVATITTMISVVGVPYDAMLNAHENMFVYSIIGIGEAILKLMAAIYLGHAIGDKLILYAVLILGVTQVSVVAMIVYCRSNYSECVLHPKLYYDNKFMKQMLSFGGWNFVGASSSMLSNYGAKIVLNRFWGVKLNAAEGVSAQITSAMLQLSNNMMKAVNPIIMKEEGQGNRSNMFSITFTSCKFMYLLYAVVSLPIFFECDYILNIWLEQVPPYASDYIRLVVLLKLIEQITAPLHSSITAIGNIRQYNIVHAALQVFMIIILIGFFSLGFPPYFHIISLIITSTLYAIYRVFFCAVRAKMPIRNFLVSVILKSLFITFVICICMYCITSYLIPSFYRFLLVVGISSALIVVLGYYILLNNYEKRAIVYIVNGIGGAIKRK